jgi:hypothetical protein
MNQPSLLDWQPPEPKPLTGPYNGSAGFKATGTSEEAAHKITPTLQEAYDAILKALNEHGPMAPHRIAQVIGRHLNYVRPRCTEMRRHHGLLVKTGKREINPDTGMSASVLDVKRDGPTVGALVKGAAA